MIYKNEMQVKLRILQFIFLGADIDAVKTASSFGIDSSWKEKIKDDYKKEVN